MKQKLTTLLFCLFALVFSLQAQKSYESISLKTNLLSFWNIGIEFPVKDKFSVELNSRRLGSSFRGDHVRRDNRLHVKYHLDLPALANTDHSVYLMLGLHRKYRLKDRYEKETGINEIKHLDVLRSVAGVGMRFGLWDVWLAAEHSMFEKHNHQTYRDQWGRVFEEKPWKRQAGISFGISYSILTIRKSEIKDFRL